MLTPSYAQVSCPTCRAPLRRVRRLASERAQQDVAALRRYRCTAPDCGWQGLLPRRVRQARKVARRRLWRNLRKLVLPAAGLAGVAAAMAAVAWQAGLFQPKAERLYARGEFHDGELLPKAHPLTRHHAHRALEAAADAASAAVPVPVADTLSLRYSCVWGQPGRNPYRGTVEQALRSAALPEEVVKSIAAQVRAGQPVDELEIRNDGVRARSSGRVFNAQNIAMTYGRTLCLSTRVNFVEGHTETAALYEATTARGRVIAVMVPKVCGNVSVLGQRADGERLVLKTQGAGEDAADMRWMPAVLEGPNAGPTSSDPGAAQEVPEPGTLSCVLAALGCLLGLRVWRSRWAAA